MTSLNQPASQNIVMEHVSKTFMMGGKGLTVLQDINLSLRPGSIVAVTGRSGAGKSTLLHLIGALDQPTQGRITVSGVNIAGLDDRGASRFRNRMIGFVFQLSHLLPEFSALENVMMPGLIADVPKKSARDRAVSLLNAVGLGQRLEHRPSELSGGEMQRVAIARALFMAPPVLLADEPTGNLDQKSSHAVQDLLLEICRDHGITMMLVTHDKDLADRLPHQIVMEDGRIIEGGIVA